MHRTSSSAHASATEVHPGWPERFNVWFTNLIGGAPSQPSPGQAPTAKS